MGGHAATKVWGTSLGWCGSGGEVPWSVCLCWGTSICRGDWALLSCERLSHCVYHCLLLFLPRVKSNIW